MATTVLTVPGISCEHCAHTVTEALTPVEGIKQVTVDIPSTRVRVEYDQSQVSIEKMREVLAEEDYPVASIQS